MDPEINQQLEEQLRQLADLLGQQNENIRQNMNSSKASATASQQQTNAQNNAAASTTKYQQAQQLAATQTTASSERLSKAFEVASGLIGAAAQSANKMLMAFGYAAVSGKEGLTKYSEAIDAAASTVQQVTAKMGLLGVAIDIFVQNATKQAKDALELGDRMTTLQREVVKTSGALPVTRTELTRLANEAGFAGAHMEKFGKAMQSAGSGLVGLGATAGQGAVKFAKIADVSEDVRQRFDRMGVSFDQLAEYQARYIKQQTLSGNAMQLQAKSAAQVQRESLAYAENLIKLTGLTGKQADQLQAEQDKVRLAAEEQLAVLADNAKIDRLRKEGNFAEAARLKAESDARQKVTSEIGNMLSPELAMKVGTAARTGNLAKTPELAQLGFSASEIQSLMSDPAGAQKFFDLYKQRAGGMSERLGTVREYLTPEQRMGLGIGDEAAIQQLNALNGKTMAERVAAQKKDATAAGQAGRDTIQDEMAKLASEERIKTAQYNEKLIGLLEQGLPKLTATLENFDSIAKIAAVALGVLAAAAGAASLAMGARSLAGMIRGGAGGAAARGAGTALGAAEAAAGGAGAAGAGARGAGLGARLLPFLGRLGMGGLAGAGTKMGGDALRDYLKENGYIGDTGSAWMNVLSDTAAGAVGVGITAKNPWAALGGGIAGLGVGLYNNWDNLWGGGGNKSAAATAGAPADAIAEAKKAQTVAEDRARADTLAAEAAKDSAGTNKTSFGSLNKTLETTNKSLSLFRDLLNLLNQVLSPSAAASGVAPSSLGGGGASSSGTTTGGGVTTLPGVPGQSQVSTLPTSPSSGGVGMFGSGSVPGMMGGLAGPNGMMGMPMQGFDGNMGRILATIRQVESGGKYDTPGPRGMPGSASGAYAFIDSSWRGLTRKYGIGTEYSRAFMAPPQVQDAVAARYAQEILEKTGGDVSRVPIAWYTGNVNGQISSRAIAINNGMTPQAYQAKWMGIYSGQGGMPMMGGGMPSMGMPMFGGMMGGDGGLISNLAMMSGMMGGMGMMPYGGMMGGGMPMMGGGMPMMGASPDIVSLGRMLQAQGFRVSENPAFGGVAPVHKGRGHYEGRAIDVNVGVGSKEAYDPVNGARFDMLANQLRTAGYHVVWRAPGHYDHMHVETKRMQAARGGIFSGPKSGYPMELHGTEMVAPLTPNSLLMSLAKMPANQLLDSTMTGIKGSPTSQARDLQKTVSAIVAKETTQALDSINENNKPIQNISMEITNSMRTMMDANRYTMSELTYKLSEMIDALKQSNDTTKKILKKASA